MIAADEAGGTGGESEAGGAKGCGQARLKCGREGPVLHKSKGVEWTGADGVAAHHVRPGVRKAPPNPAGQARPRNPTQPLRGPLRNPQVLLANVAQTALRVN